MESKQIVLFFVCAQIVEYTNGQYVSSNFSMSTSTPIGKGRPPLRDDQLSDDLVSLSVQNQDLQDKLQGLQTEVEDFELVRADWQIEKEALEDVLIKLRQQLQEKDEELQASGSSQV